jgi:hypothetical protein
MSQFSRLPDHIRYVVVVFDTLVRLGFDEETSGIVVGDPAAVRIYQKGKPYEIVLDWEGSCTEADAALAMSAWNELSQRERQEECDHFMPLPKIFVFLQMLIARGVRIPTGETVNLSHLS